MKILICYDDRLPMLVAEKILEAANYSVTSV